MMRLTKTFGSLLISIILSASGLVGIGVAHAAGSATMSLSPASGSVNSGSNLVLAVHEDSGSTTVYGARVALSYPSSLTFVSFTPSSAFSVTAVNKGGSGSAEYDAGSTGVSGDQVVATVTFTATQGSGTANVTVNPPNPSNQNDYTASAVSDGSGNNILATVSSGSYTLTGASTGGSTSGSGSSSGTGTSSGSSSTSSSSKTSTSSSSKTSTSTSKSVSSPAPSPSATPITISDVNVSNITAKTAVVSWTTSAATSSEVDYGTSSQYVASATDTAQVTKHSLTLDTPNLAGDTTYHFIVKGQDASGNQVTGQDMTFHTAKGVTLALTVVDQHNKPVSKATVSAYAVNGNTTGTLAFKGVTDGSGKVTLLDLPSGQIKITATHNGAVVSKTITLTTDQSQSQTVKLDFPGSNTGWIVVLVLIVLAIILVLVVRAIMRGHRENTDEISRHFPKLPGSGGNSTPGMTSGGSGGSIVKPGGGSGTSPGSSSTGLTQTTAPPGNTITPTNNKTG